jgi:ring-1,2-phenylacetyl-CoA epoxidase subunit PaaC
MSEAARREFESLDGMPDACARGLHHLLLACADTKLLLGYHYGEWTFGTPALEAAVASCSLSQAELGHVRLLHALLDKHFGDAPDALVDRRPPHEFANVGFLDRPVTDWPGFVAVNYVVDLAVTRVLHAVKHCAFRPLGMSVDKMLDEERYHLHHGRGWFRTLAARGGDDRRALEGHVRAALESVAEWLGPADEPEDRALVAAGVKAADNAALLAAVRRDVAELAEPLGVDTAVAPPSSFAGWTAANRRIGGGGPDEEILFHLRGAKNAMYKLS